MKRHKEGFTLIELLVVISIIAMLLSILLPAISKIRTQARQIISSNNKKQISGSVMLYSSDNSGRFPDSVATLASNTSWNWHNPKKIVTNNIVKTGTYRSVASYLNDYISFEFFNNPENSKPEDCLADIWKYKDDWDNPKTPPTFHSQDQFVGSYCLYWNYMGCLDKNGERLFEGPKSSSTNRKESKILISDYLGYGHWLSKNLYGSSRKFNKANLTEKYDNFIQWWQGEKLPNILLKAGFVDGSVRSYSSNDAVKLWVPIFQDFSETYDDGMGPGVFYLPQNHMR